MARGSFRYTPEAIEEIQSLIAAGVHRECIAELLGTTVGSLQVSCSKRGISLRRSPGTHIRQPIPRRSKKSQEPKNALPQAVIKRRKEEQVAQLRLVNLRLKVPMSPEVLGLLTMRAEKLQTTVDIVAMRLLETIARDNLYDAVIDEEAA